MMTQQQAAEKFLPLIQAYGQPYSKKTQVLARPATPGEQVVTMTGDGKETQNVAKEGDFVVKNLTQAGEEYLLSPAKLSARYKELGAEQGGWTRYQATGSIKGIRFNGQSMGLPDHIEFVATWGEPMVLKSGDMIATPDGKEVYRIAAKEFGETYA